jgi:hypothetical protein
MDQQWTNQANEPFSTMDDPNMPTPFDYNMLDPALRAQDAAPSHTIRTTYHTTPNQAPGCLFMSFRCVEHLNQLPLAFQSFLASDCLGGVNIMENVE